MSHACPAALVILTAAFLLLPACATRSDDREPSGGNAPQTVALTALLESEWTVLSVAGDVPPEGCTPTLMFIEITPGDASGVFVGRAGGSGGVNRTGGQVTVGPNTAIRFGPMMSTMMAGPEPHMRFERAYLDALQGATAFAVSANASTLTLTGGATIVLGRANQSPR